MGQNPNRTPSEQVVHPPQNGTIGFDPQTKDEGMSQGEYNTKTYLDAGHVPTQPGNLSSKLHCWLLDGDGRVAKCLSSAADMHREGISPYSPQYLSPCCPSVHAAVASWSIPVMGWDPLFPFEIEKQQSLKPEM